MSQKTLLVLSSIVFSVGVISSFFVMRSLVSGKEVARQPSTQIQETNPENKSEVSELKPYEIETQEIKVFADRMEPTVITAKAGNSVQFNPKDGLTHKIGIGEGKTEESDHEHDATSAPVEIKADEGYKVSFNKPGTYYYHDHENPASKVMIVVFEEGVSPKVE